MESFLDIEFCVQDDEPKADWESVVAGVVSEEIADCIEGCFVKGDCGMIRDGPRAATAGRFAPDVLWGSS